MRYHLLPFLIPKKGIVYELKTTMDAKILYFKDETVLGNHVEFFNSSLV